ncbi:MAG: hypothetical protein IAG10_22205, partial [Planctomycetaceae bacterium]|nr:hypothetical protein [Planctomycetaceae bacterium]
MYGDFSRDSFDSSKLYNRVLMQQGRPLTDADWNEQASIIADREWRLIKSLLGANHGTFDDGFAPHVEGGTSLSFCLGSYYVDGLRCETGEKKPDAYPLDSLNGPLLLFLDAWEQSVNPIMDPALLDPALGSNDTAWRSRVTWQVKLKQVKEPKPEDKGPIPVVADPNKICACPYAAVGVCKPDQRVLEIRRAPSALPQPGSPCDLSTSDRSSSLEEAVYRIEVHRMGVPFTINSTAYPVDGAMRFKWTKENGAAVYPVKDTVGTSLVVDNSRFVSRLPLQPDDRLELRDQTGRSANQNRALVGVTGYERGRIELSKAFVPQLDETPPLVV